MYIDMEYGINYRCAGIFVLLIFYGIYFGKMLQQKKKGIRTHQIGKRKEKSLHRVETLMSVATAGVVVAQVISIIYNWNVMPANARLTGFVIGMLGNLIFFLAVYQMRDSWRAGIPDEDHTRFVSTGVYSFSRNPAFVGFDFMYVGVLLMFGNPLNLLFSVFSIVMLHLQILQEEQYLAQAFGSEYLDYKQKVFRYLGRR